MNCIKPFHKKGASFGCLQCMPCRINTARKWTARMVLEACCHEQASFITLTYDEEHLPDGGTLVPRDLQLWLKRLREQCKFPIRFYAVGEYGDRTQRPHYHAALFGVGREHSLVVRETWGCGLTDTGDLTIQSARYIAGYVTKKLTKRDDPRLLAGQHPEFARMSLRPGIGASALSSLAASFSGSVGRRYIEVSGDVPSVFRNGSSLLPFDRYLREGLRHELQVTPHPSVEIARARFKKMLDVYQRSKCTQGFSAFERNRRQQKILQMITKQKIYAQKGKL